MTDARASLAVGRAAETTSLMREMFAVWRGWRLPISCCSAPARGVAELEERRVAALEQRIEADLALGRHTERWASVSPGDRPALRTALGPTRTALTAADARPSYRRSAGRLRRRRPTNSGSIPSRSCNTSSGPSWPSTANRLGPPAFRTAASPKPRGHDRSVIEPPAQTEVAARFPDEGRRSRPVGSRPRHAITRRDAFLERCGPR
jgi:hypothetical protein